MKHVFSVHSPITFLAAHAIVHQLAIPLTDVIILRNNYELPVDKYRSYPFYSNHKQHWYQKIAALNTPKQEDRYLDGIIGEEAFTAYIDLMSFHQTTLITHRQCAAFHFMEEGAFAYREKETIVNLNWDWYRMKSPLRVVSWKDRIKQFYQALKWTARGYSLNLLAMPYSYNTYAAIEGVKYFGFSENAFPLVPAAKRVRIQLDGETPDIDALAKGICLRDTFIWVDGARGKFTGVPDEIYHQAVDDAISIFYEEMKGKGVAIKLRPGQKNYADNYLHSALSSAEIPLRVLPDDIVLECVFINATNCKVIGNVSPALLYANTIAGLESFTIYSLYKQKKATLLDDLPGFWSFVKPLKNTSS